MKAGDTVMIHGFLCKVVSAGGKCEEADCSRPTLTIIDPQGHEDTVHEDECDGASK